MRHEKERLANRYQNKPWYIKLWRRRWYLTIPFEATYLWLASKMAGEPMSWKLCWALSEGLVCFKMEWWFTDKETYEKITTKIESMKANKNK